MISTIFVLLLALPAAYALSIKPVEKWTDVMFFFLSTKFLPPIAALLPIYLIVEQVGMLDNIFTLVFLYTSMNLPIAVWMMRSFLAEVPEEILEAAQVDGAGLLRTLRKIVAPIVGAGPRRHRLICFIFSWNEFMFAVNLTATRASTSPVFLVGFISSQGLFLAKLCAAAAGGLAAGADRRVRRAGQAGPRPVPRRGEVTLQQPRPEGRDLDARERAARRRRPRRGGAPRPGARPHEVLVGSRRSASADPTCTTTSTAGSASYVVDAPLVLGHEARRVVGRRRRGHPARRRSARVDRAGRAGPHCPQCLAGRYNLCPRHAVLRHPADRRRVRRVRRRARQFAHPVPDSLSDDAAALLEPLSVGVWACRKGGVGAGLPGAGHRRRAVGLVGVQTALAFGAAGSCHRRQPAPARAGPASSAPPTRSTPAGPGRRRGLAVDVLLECSGNPRATGDAVRAVAPAGRVVLVGMGGDELPLPLSAVQERELEITGTFRYANTWPTAIALAASGRVDLDRLVTGHYGLDQVEEALTVGAPTAPSRPSCGPARDRG